MTDTAGKAVGGVTDTAGNAGKPRLSSFIPFHSPPPRSAADLVQLAELATPLAALPKA